MICLFENKNMRYCYIVLILIVSVFASMETNAETIDGVTEVRAGGMYSELELINNADVTFNGDFTIVAQNGSLIIEAGSKMVVNGALRIIGRYASVQINGTLIVTENVFIGGRDAENSVGDDGVLTVGGDYNSVGRNLEETNDGSVYLSDPTDWGDSDGDITDLIEADPPVLPEEDLIDFIEDIGYDTDLLPASDWQGDEAGSATDWNISGNWADGSVPTTASNVTIPTTPSGGSVFPTDCGNNVYYMWNLTLENNAELTIPAGSQVTVFGDINIGTGANLTVENSVAQPTSFLHYGQVNGNITYKWSYNSGNWWLIGHAISNPTMANYDAILAGGNDYAMYDYQDLSVMQRISKTAFDFSAQDEIRGYLLKVKNNASISHTGLLNSADVYSKTLQTGWQVIANPYASYYQLPTEASSGADFEHTTGSVYVTVSTSNSDKVYHTFNTVTGVGTPAISDGTFNGIIAPTQAFYVETTSGSEGQNVYMRSVHRVHDAAKAALKSGQVSKEQDILRIKLDNNNAVDEAVILLREDGEFGLTRMDSKQRFVTGNSLSYIYSVVDDVETVINVLPYELDDFQQVLGIKAYAGQHSLSIEGISNLSANYDLVLEDKELGIFTTMVDGVEYTFDTEEINSEQRFVLHLKAAPIATDIDDVERNEELYEAKVYIQDQSMLSIECNWGEKEKFVTVYDLSGQQLLNEAFEGNEFRRNLPFTKGIYLVKLEGDKKTFEQKVFVQ